KHEEALAAMKSLMTLEPAYEVGEEVRLTLDAEPSPPELAAAARLVATLSSPRVHGGAFR
ncbi:MAG TPA: hypothetical protein RMH26_18855, partial [Polyangiaceae bacterium LLY-WYZ-15_(1-7)]|nr:hypothetical protein [Polyangiaceae bacterium LLY-WYZ-15_(1-7)]